MTIPFKAVFKARGGKVELIAADPGETWRSMSMAERVNWIARAPSDASAAHVASLSEPSAEVGQ